MKLGPRLGAGLAALALTVTALTMGVASPSAVAVRTTSTVRTAKAALATKEKVRLLAQQGLAIALASNVLHTQLDALFYADDTDEVGKCGPLPGGGSLKIASVTATTHGSVTTDRAVFDYYYGAACSQLYMTQKAVVSGASDGSGSSSTETGTTVYHASSGRRLGAMTTSATLAESGQTLVADGLGVFTVPGLSKPVSLGLDCAIDGSGAGSSLTMPCQGGIAQTFPKLKKSLGSVTNLSLTVANGFTELLTGQGAVTFTGSKAVRRIAKPGKLSITSPNHRTLTLRGKGSSAGSVRAIGRTASFSLFPPTPTGWTITDTKHHLVFAIKVTSNTSRKLTATVKSSKTHKTLAKISLDRSGTGKVTYAKAARTGKATAKVASWILIG